jgi:hypothetical protein
LRSVSLVAVGGVLLKAATSLLRLASLGCVFINVSLLCLHLQANFLFFLPCIFPH